LVRKSDDDAIFRANTADAGKVTIDKIVWFMPHVLPADAEKFSIYKEIESNVSLPVAYRTSQCDTIRVPQATTFAWRLGVKNAPEKPRWIVIGFQTGKSGDRTQNPAIFDHVNLKNMYVMLNSTRYPAVDYNLSFANPVADPRGGDGGDRPPPPRELEKNITSSTIVVNFCADFPSGL